MRKPSRLPWAFSVMRQLGERGLDLLDADGLLAFGGSDADEVPAQLARDPVARAAASAGDVGAFVPAVQRLRQGARQEGASDSVGPDEEEGAREAVALDAAAERRLGFVVPLDPRKPLAHRGA